MKLHTFIYESSRQHQPQSNSSDFNLRNFSHLPSQNMSQQADPSGQQSAAVYTAPPGEPPFVPEPLPLKNQVTLYFRALQTDPIIVEQLVYLITKRKIRWKGENCDPEEQEKIGEAAKAHSKDVNHPWQWNPENIGRYIASGLTQFTDLDLVIGHLEEHIPAIVGGRKAFPPDRVAQMKDSEIYKAAEKRILANRAAYPVRTAAEDRLRQDKQAMQAPPQLTPEEVAMHATLAGEAARQIQEKKKK